jgi:transmembrane sensor
MAMSGVGASPQDLAIGWALRHVEGAMSAGEIEAFADWLHQDPAHGEAFEQAMAAWAMLEGPRFEPEILALRSEALGALQAAQRRRWRLPGLGALVVGPGRLAAAAAGVLLAVGLGLHLWLAPDHYRTGTGERRVVTLADGSILAMDAQTSVSVDYRADGRHLTLENGRASFTVAKDPLHPFSVVSHGSVVVATGTQFSVEWMGRQTRVVLYEGHVAVLRQGAGVAPGRAAPSVMMQQAGWIPADTLLTPGHELVVPEDAAPVQMHALADPHAERLWEQGQIDVSDEPLGLVAARMNRYLPGPRLLVARDAADVRISGLFNAGDLEAFVSGVTQVFPVVAERQDDGSFCLSRQRNSSHRCG